MRKISKSTTSLIAISLSAMFGTAAYAQGNAAAADSDGEIVVQARRTNESIQSTPVSITAFSGDALRDANIRNTADLMIKTPGVNFGGSGGRENSTFQIRGLSKSRTGFMSPAVATYFADVPMPVVGSGVPTFDLQSVQVLKGPQGTLFGRNTMGGAVLFYPVLPSYDFDGYVEAGYGRFNNVQLEGALTIPIVDGKVALRVSGRYDKSDGYTHDLTHNVMLDNQDIRAIRASLLLEPTDGIRNVTTVDWYENKSNGESVVPTKIRTPSFFVDTLTNTRTAAEAALAAQILRGPRAVENDMTPYSHTVRRGITNRTDIDINDNLSVTNIIGYRRNYVGFNINIDGFGPLHVTGTGTDPDTNPDVYRNLLHGGLRVHVDQFTEELQLKGKLYEGRVNWLLGAFYLRSSPWAPMGQGSKAASASTADFTTFAYNFLTDDSRAVFGNLNLELAEGLKLDLGGRYTWDKSSGCTASETAASSGAAVLGQLGPETCAAQSSLLVGPATARFSSKAPTWQASLEYQATDNIFAYVTTRRGYRSGSVNTPTFAGALAPYQGYKPEYVNDIEGGFRTDWKISDDVRLRFNASAFISWGSDTIYSLSQVATNVAACLLDGPNAPAAGFTNGRLNAPDGDCDTTNDPISGAMSINAGKTQVRGVDIDGFIALGRSFKFTFAGNLLDPKSKGVSVPTALLPYKTGNVIGFDFVAKHTYTLGGEFNTSLGSAGDLTANLDWYHSGRTSFSDARFPSYSVVNGRLSLNNVGGMPIDLSVYGTNIFDEEYIVGGAFNGPGSGVEASLFGAPAQYGASIRYRFGGK